MTDRPEGSQTRVVTGVTPLARFGAIHRAAVRAEWAAAVAAGLDLRIREVDGLLFGAAPGLASGMFNRALGLTEQPERLAEARAFFDANGVVGEVTLAPEDVPPAVEIALRLDAYLDAAAGIDPPPSRALSSVRSGQRPGKRGCR